MLLLLAAYYTRDSEHVCVCVCQDGGALLSLLLLLRPLLSPLALCCNSSYLFAVFFYFGGSLFVCRTIFCIDYALCTLSLNIV